MVHPVACKAHQTDAPSIIHPELAHDDMLISYQVRCMSASNCYRKCRPLFCIEAWHAYKYSIARPSHLSPHLLIQDQMTNETTANPIQIKAHQPRIDSPTPPKCFEGAGGVQKRFQPAHNFIALEQFRIDLC